MSTKPRKETKWGVRPLTMGEARAAEPAPCAHVTLKRKIAGSTAYYQCECGQKFHAEEWDGTVRVVAAEPAPKPTELPHCPQCGEEALCRDLKRLGHDIDPWHSQPDASPVNSLSVQKRRHIREHGSMKDFKPQPVRGDAPTPERTLEKCKCGHSKKDHPTNNRVGDGYCQECRCNEFVEAAPSPRESQREPSKEKQGVLKEGRYGSR